MKKREFKSVAQVAKENDCSPRTVANWCQKDGGVPYVGEGRGKQWLIYPDDEDRFKNREKPGRRWPVKKTGKKK